MQWRSSNSSVVDDRGAGRAHVAGRAGLPLLFLRQELELDGDRPVLFDGHGPGVLRVEHQAAVEPRVLGRIRHELADEAVFQGQSVVRERRVVVQVAEAVAEFVVAVVADLDEAVLGPKGVGVVVPDLVALELRGPSVQRLSVEQIDPGFLVRILRFRRRSVSPAQAHSSSSSTPTRQDTATLTRRSKLIGGPVSLPFSSAMHTR